MLTTSELKLLSQQSNAAGLMQLTGHLAVLGGLAVICGWHRGSNIGLRLLALVVYGFSLATTFAPVHECVHRTAFANNRLNDWGWLGWPGCLSAL